MSVHFRSESWDDLEADFFLTYCRFARNDLVRRFGVSFTRLHVFVFDNKETIVNLAGAPFGGFALPRSSSVVVARCGLLEDMARHELVHVFAARWNSNAPGLLREGLAVWLQRKYGSITIDDAARNCIRGQPTHGHGSAAEFYVKGRRPLFHCLQEKNFCDAKRGYACYVLSGSFTGYLLRHFGWSRYQRWYRVATSNSIVRDFERTFGLTLDQAEKKWRVELQCFAPMRTRK
jgi:hypothetical protein